MVGRRPYERSGVNRRPWRDGEGRLSAVHPCPCCGYKTLPRRDHYDLCPVCNWEDEGEAPWAYSGANGETLVEAQQRFLTQTRPYRLRAGKVRAPTRGEERDPEWRPIEVTDEVWAQVKRSHDDWDRSFETGTEGMDEQVDENLRRYGEAYRLLETEAAFLPHREVQTRLEGLSEAHGLGFSEAHLELFARLMKCEDYYRGHPLRTASWLLRHSSLETCRRRWKEVRTGNVFFAG